MHKVISVLRRPRGGRFVLTTKEKLILYLGLVTFIVAEFHLFRFAPWEHYAGGDGKGYMATITSHFAFTAWNSITALDPLRGMFSTFIPMNVWLNPVTLPFHIWDGETRNIFSAMAAASLLAGGLFIFLRAFEVPWFIALPSSEAILVLFAPLSWYVGNGTQFLLNPGVAFEMGLWFVLVAIFANPALSLRMVCLQAALAAAISAYAIYIDVTWYSLMALIYMPVISLLLLTRGGKYIWRALIMAGLCGGILYVTGFVDFTIDTMTYTARLMFASETANRSKIPAMVTFMAYPEDFTRLISGGKFLLLLLMGNAIGIFTLRGRARKLAIANLCLMLLWTIYSLIYLLSPSPWILPVPSYYEQSFVPLYLVVGVAGLLAAVHHLTPGTVPEIVRGNDLAKAVLVMPLLFLFVALILPKSHREKAHEPWPNNTKLLEKLTKLSLAEDRVFRGTAFVTQAGYNTQMANAELWKHHIPLLNEYSPLVTPQMHFFVSRLMAPPKTSGVLNGFWVRNFRERLLSAMGVRYFVDTINGAPDDFRSSENIAGPLEVDEGGNHPFGQKFYVYEFKRANLGNYAPTKAISFDSAADAVDKMDRQDFDFRHEVLLKDRVDNLIPATTAEMRVFATGVKIHAESPGTSMLLLPIQFSHCLKLRADGTRLVRANLIFTGLVFSKAVDAELQFRYSPIHNRCRKMDIQDMKTLGIVPDPQRSLDLATLAPFAVHLGNAW